MIGHRDAIQFTLVVITYIPDKTECRIFIRVYQYLFFTFIFEREISFNVTYNCIKRSKLVYNIYHPQYCERINGGRLRVHDAFLCNYLQQTCVDIISFRWIIHQGILRMGLILEAYII